MSKSENRKSPKKSPRAKKNEDTVSSVYTKASLQKLVRRAGIHRTSFNSNSGSAVKSLEILYEFISELQESLFRNISIILNLYKVKTVTLSHVVKAAKILGVDITATNAMKEKSAKAKKTTSEKRRPTGTQAASEVKRLQKTSGLLIANSPFGRLMKARMNEWTEKVIRISPSAMRVAQLYIESRILDLLTISAILLVRDGLKAHKTLDARHLDTALIIYKLTYEGIQPDRVGIWESK